MWRALLVLSLINSILCVVPKKDLAEVLEKNRMVGVDAIHNVKIDKDTIITRNMKMEQKGRGKNVISKKEDQEPDWSYNSIPQELSSHVEQFKRNMTECLKEVQAKEKSSVKRLSPKRPSPVHGECLVACVLKRNGVIEKGKIHKDNLINLVSKFYAKNTKLMKKLVKNIDRCIESSTQHHDECMMASKLNDCSNDLMASNNKNNVVINY